MYRFYFEDHKTMPVTIMSEDIGDQKLHLTQDL